MQARWAWQEQEKLRGAIWEWLTEAPGERRAAGRGGRVAYAFQLWIAHLAMLEQLMAVSPGDWRALLAAEAEGLGMLQSARQRYAREYRSCDECGAAVRGKICSRCGAVGTSTATVI